MIQSQMTERFNQSAKGLNQRLYAHVVKLPSCIKEQAQEIRLRVNRPVCVCCNDGNYFLTENYQITTTILNNQMLSATQRDISETFQNICCYSVYSRQNEIKNGFITMQGGHRAGICGTAVYNNGILANIRDISSINIRIARQINGAADALMDLVGNTAPGLLICGVPSSGKTTVLRDLARQLSDKSNLKVSVVDERGELAGTSVGVFQNDLGQCDILDGYQKGQGMMHALRCLSPDVIICDEIGSEDECMAVEESINSGVKLVATIHAGCKEELLKRPQALRLLKTGAFEKIVFLKSRSEPGRIREVLNWEDIKNAATVRSNHDNFKLRHGGRFTFTPPDYKDKVL